MPTGREKKDFERVQIQILLVYQINLDKTKHINEKT